MVDLILEIFLFVVILLLIAALSIVWEMTKEEMIEHGWIKVRP